MLQIRFHPNLNGKDTLMFIGSGPDINRVRTLFSEWEGNEVEIVSSLKEKGEIYKLAVDRLILKQDRIKNAFRWDKDQGSWIVSQTYKDNIIRLLDRLTANDVPGHEYLNCFDVGNAHIMVSKSETPLNGSGQPVTGFVRSKKGMFFSAESVPVLRDHVRSSKRDNLVPYISVRIDDFNQHQPIRAGNETPRPHSLEDELEDMSFYWHGDRFSPYVGKYFVDLEFQRKSYFIPLPSELLATAQEP